jgi:hypothetical protein
VFVREYGYTVTENDPERPWVVRDQRHETVQLADDVPFFQWSTARYPRDRFTVQLDPWSLTPGG